MSETKRCPDCGEPLEPVVPEVLSTSFVSTHRCPKCGVRFQIIPARSAASYPIWLRSGMDI